MDYYQYQLLLQQQQHHQQQQQQQFQQTQMNIMGQLNKEQSFITQPSNLIAPTILYNPSQIHSQPMLSSQSNFKDTQFLGQPSALQLQELNNIGNLMQQQQQQIMVNDTNGSIQPYANSAVAGIGGGIDLSQQVFFQKAIQNQYINNIQQNREDIIRNYINIISHNRNRNPSNDNRNRNPSNDNRNRNLSNENRNQNMNQPQMNNQQLQQTSSTVQKQFNTPQQLGTTFQIQQVFQQQQQAQQQQQYFAQTQKPSTWMQTHPATAAPLPEMNKQFLGEASFQTQTSPMQQNRHHSQHMHHQQHQQLQMVQGMNLNDISAFSQQSTNDQKQTVQSNPNMNFSSTPIQQQYQQQQQIKPTVMQSPVATLQKQNEDPLIESFDQENIRLQQSISAISSKLQQLNISQAEIIALDNYNSNKTIIDYLEQQIQLFQNQKKQVIEQIESLQTLKLAYSKYKLICPEGGAHSFMTLSKETQLLFLSQPLPFASKQSVKIEHTPLLLAFPADAQQDQKPLQDDQKSVSSKNSSSSNQKKNPFKVIRSNENSEDPDIAFLNRKRETPIQSPSLSKQDEQQQTIQNIETSQPKDTQVEQINEVVTLEKSVEESKPIEKESVKEIEQQNEQQMDEANEVNQNSFIDEEEETDKDNHNHDHDNTTFGQSTFSIAKKLSSMNPAESKKFEKRREKLEENVIKILEKSEDACSKIKPIALELCSKIAVEGDVLKNRPYEAISAAVIVHASRLVANPITVKKMAKITESKEKIINRVFMYLKKNVEGFNNKMPQPEVFIRNICEKMKLDESISSTAFFLHQQSDNLGLVKGQHAATVAACIVKLAAYLNKQDMTVKQICEASNVCQISLRQLYRTIYPHRFELIGDHKINDIDFKKILNSPQMNLD